MGAIASRRPVLLARWPTLGTVGPCEAVRDREIAPDVAAACHHPCQPQLHEQMLCGRRRRMICKLDFDGHYDLIRDRSCPWQARSRPKPGIRGDAGASRQHLMQTNF
jgi:hypothetical protein